MGRVAAADPRIGSELAGYRIAGLVGRGATSSVYRAVELRLERDVALKVLSAELTRDHRFERRFLRESRLAASLEHPNVIPIFAAGEANGQLYIAMRLIEGSDLKALLTERGRLPAERALALCAQLGSALDAAHASGLVHRDVKPSNVLLERDTDGAEHVFLADFGLTKTAAPGSASTQTGQMIGTIDYMAPEQIRGEELDGRADLYSLGCLLYECLTGDPPFTRGSEVATLYAHLHDPPTPASQRRPVLPTSIDPVFERALAKKPGDRYPTCAAFVAEARTALGLPEETIHRPWRLRRRRRAVVAVIGLALAAAAAGVVFAVGGGGRANAAPIHLRFVQPGYRVTATERITNGAPGGYPIVGLIAAVDDGKGPVASNQSRKPTGELVFRFDPGQFEANGGDLLGAAPGSVIGYVVDWVTSGGSFVQLPVRKSGLTDGGIVHGEIELPPEYVPIIGRILPLTFRQTPDALIGTLNLQDVVRKTHASGGDTKSSKYTGLYLIGSARNPFEPTRFDASVSARPCVDVECTKLGPGASDAIPVALPEDLGIRAPARAFYGQPVTFTGSGVPGKPISIVYTGKPGPEPPCTPSTIRPHRCGPRLAPAWVGDSDLRTAVRSDGTWSLAVPLVPSFGDGFGPSGRYSAVEWSDDSLRGGPLFGGASSVIQEASRDTVVALAKPLIRITRSGRQLAIGISVKGGDSLVRYRLGWRSHEVASGRLASDGTATELVPAPVGYGSFEVTVSAAGTESASASTRFRSGTEGHSRIALPGYRVTASERLTSGAPGSHPTVGLIALIDDGRGPKPRSLSQITTGELAFRFDSRQVSFEFMAHARPGTRLGYYASNDTAGGQFVQQPAIKVGLSTDPKESRIVDALVTVPAQFAPVLGKGVPLTIREIGEQVVATLNLQRVVRRFRASGAAFGYSNSGLYLLGGLHRHFGNAAEPIVTNPADRTILHASVSARPCVDLACAKLGREATDAIAMELPQELSVQAPRRAWWGQPALFRGTGAPGDWITILRAVGPGSAPACTPVNFAQRSCAPPIGTVFVGDAGMATTVRPDGTWSLAVPVPTRSSIDPRFGESGRYAAAESPDRLSGRLLEGGSSTVLAQAPADTVIALPKPALTIRREARRLAVGIRVQGGDDSAHYRLRWRGRVVAAGRLRAGGTATAVVPIPSVVGRFVATVSAPGAASASGYVDYKPSPSRAGAL